MSDDEQKRPTNAGEPEPSAEGDAAKVDAAKAKAEAAAAARAKKAAEEAAKPAWERDPVAPAIEDASDDPLAAGLREAHGASLEHAVAVGGELVLQVARGEIREVCQSLAEDYGYRLLVDLCGVDYPSRENERFEVVYLVHNLEENRRIRLRVRVPEGEEVPSVCGVWRGADWCEREVFDMFGIRFADHPDMTRILMWEGFHGHPLRKDFPIEGIDTGAAIYPEYYDDAAGPIGGTGTGWKPSKAEADQAPETTDSGKAGKE